MNCPKCGNELVIDKAIDVQPITDERIDIVLECDVDAGGCGYQGFWVLNSIDILTID